MKILILEDEKYFLDTITKIIKDNLDDVNVYSCLSMSEFDYTHYDLALIDIQLSDGDGIEFVKENESYFDSIISGVRRKHDGTTRAFPRCLQRSAEVEYPLVEDTKRGR